MPKKYGSNIAEAMHGTVSGLRKAGLVDTKTLRDFDRRCLREVLQLSATQLASLRKREGVSQGVFAQHLNAKPKLVSEWERGEKKPSGPSLKLLSLVKAKGLEAIS